MVTSTLFAFRKLLVEGIDAARVVQGAIRSVLLPHPLDEESPLSTGGLVSNTGIPWLVLPEETFQPRANGTHCIDGHQLVALARRIVACRRGGSWEKGRTEKQQER